MRFETSAIHSGKEADPTYGALVAPLYQTSTFIFEDIGKHRGFDYSRTANPTRKVLEDAIARLEGGKAGFAYATGMAAESTVAHLLKAGDHLICGDDVYGGTYRLFEKVMKDHGVEVTFLRIDSKKALQNAIRPNTKMVWIESPSNPLLNVIDLEMVVSVARRKKLLTVMDNTFSTPFFLKPIEYGIDIVVHSTTKYLNGHCDVVGGAAVTATEELGQQVHFLTNAMGTCASPFDCWLVLRGMKTLPLRMQKHGENAQAVAEFLAAHPRVKRVYYPGLKTHPGHDIAVRQMKGFGGVVSFEVAGGARAVKKLLKGVKIFAMAESLGGVYSLIEHPATMSHASMPEEVRKAVGINDDVIRLSIGLEHPDDLTEDLDQALR